MKKLIVSLLLLLLAAGSVWAEDPYFVLDERPYSAWTITLDENNHPVSVDFSHCPECQKKLTLAWGMNPAFVVAAVESASDTTAPTFSSATINATAATVTLSEDVVITGLDDGDFVMTGSTTGASNLNSCSEDAGVISCTAADTFVNGETVTLAYSGTTDEVEDLAGNDLSTFSGESVTNNTPSGTTYAHDDFTSYSTSTEHTSGGNWVDLGTTTATSIDTTNDELDTGAGSGVTILDIDLGSPDQIVCWKWTEAAQYTGFYLRNDGTLDQTYDGYAVRGEASTTDGTNTLQFRYCFGANGASCTDIFGVANMSADLDDGDWACAAISGTNNNDDGSQDAGELLVRFWDRGTTDPDTNSDDELSDSEVGVVTGTTPDVAWCDGISYSATITRDIGGITGIDYISTGNKVGYYNGSSNVGTIGEIHARALP